MALFGLNQKKDDNQMPPTFPSSSSGIPLEQVSSLRQQGLSNTQIIQNLQQQGYSTTSIYDALNQAEMKGTTDPSGYDHYPEAPDPAASTDQAYYDQPSYMSGYSSSGGGDEKIEEIAEAIIEEKWNELDKNVNKIIEWKERTETRIAQLEQRMIDLRRDFETLHGGILGKVSEYDQNLTNLGAEIKAMEKVFSKILPTFTENVNELSRLAKDIKMKGSK